MKNQNKVKYWDVFGDYFTRFDVLAKVATYGALFVFCNHFKKYLFIKRIPLTDIYDKVEWLGLVLLLIVFLALIATSFLREVLVPFFKEALFVDIISLKGYGVLKLWLNIIINLKLLAHVVISYALMFYSLNWISLPL